MGATMKLPHTIAFPGGLHERGFTHVLADGLRQATHRLTRAHSRIHPDALRRGVQPGAYERRRHFNHVQQRTSDRSDRARNREVCVQHGSLPPCGDCGASSDIWLDSNFRLAPKSPTGRLKTTAFQSYGRPSKISRPSCSACRLSIARTIRAGQLFMNSSMRVRMGNTGSGCSSKFWPNRLPVIRSEILARNLASGGHLDLDASRRRYGSGSGGKLREIGLGDSERFSQLLGCSSLQPTQVVLQVHVELT